MLKIVCLLLLPGYSRRSCEVQSERSSADVLQTVGLCSSPLQTASRGDWRSYIQVLLKLEKIRHEVILFVFFKYKIRLVSWHYLLCIFYLIFCFKFLKTPHPLNNNNNLVNQWKQLSFGLFPPQWQGWYSARLWFSGELCVAGDDQRSRGKVGLHLQPWKPWDILRGTQIFLACWSKRSIAEVCRILWTSKIWSVLLLPCFSATALAWTLSGVLSSSAVLRPVWRDWEFISRIPVSTTNGTCLSTSSFGKYAPNLFNTLLILEICYWIHTTLTHLELGCKSRLCMAQSDNKLTHFQTKL